MSWFGLFLKVFCCDAENPDFSDWIVHIFFLSTKINLLILYWIVPLRLGRHFLLHYVYITFLFAFYYFTWITEAAVSFQFFWHFWITSLRFLVIWRRMSKTMKIRSSKKEVFRETAKMYQSMLKWRRIMRKWWENKQTMQTMKKQLFLALKANNHTALLLLEKNKKIKQEKKGFRTEHSFICLYAVCFMFGFCLMRRCKCMFLWFLCYFWYTRKKTFQWFFFRLAHFSYLSSLTLAFQCKHNSVNILSTWLLRWCFFLCFLTIAVAYWQFILIDRNAFFNLLTILLMDSNVNIFEVQTFFWNIICVLNEYFLNRYKWFLIA